MVSQIAHVEATSKDNTKLPAYMDLNARKYNGLVASLEVGGFRTWGVDREYPDRGKEGSLGGGWNILGWRASRQAVSSSSKFSASMFVCDNLFEPEELMSIWGRP